jgi:hypothetical protein
MGRPREKVYELGQANFRTWFALWKVGGSYIDVFPTGNRDKVTRAYQKGISLVEVVLVHAINITGYELGDRTPDQLVRTHLEAWVKENGEDYFDNTVIG